MIDPTRLAAIKALCGLMPPLGKLSVHRISCETAIAGHYIALAEHGGPAMYGGRTEAEFFIAAADPDYGLQSLAAEVERLQDEIKTIDRDYQAYAATIRANIPVEFTKQPQLDLCMQRMKEEILRLREREKPVKLSLTKLMNSNRFSDPPACKCGKLMMDRWSYCPNCGRKLEWS